MPLLPYKENTLETQLTMWVEAFWQSSFDARLLTGIMYRTEGYT